MLCRVWKIVRNLHTSRTILIAFNIGPKGINLECLENHELQALLYIRLEHHDIKDTEGQDSSVKSLQP